MKESTNQSWLAHVPYRESMRAVMTYYLQDIACFLLGHRADSGWISAAEISQICRANEIPWRDGHLGRDEFRHLLIVQHNSEGDWKLLECRLELKMERRGQSKTLRLRFTRTNPAVLPSNGMQARLLNYLSLQGPGTTESPAVSPAPQPPTPTPIPQLEAA